MVAHDKLPVLDLISDQMRAVLAKSAELAELLTEIETIQP